jgi:phage shock protein PspC (stress-responsive transcriptional regulator)
MIMGTRKLMRDTNNAVFGGVCSGIANYLNMDATIVRLIVAVLLFTGASFFIYLLAWLLMPATDSKTEIF